MRLTRCKDQPGSLEEFYGPMLDHDESIDREIGAAMLDLIERLRALPSTRQAWGLTSHYHLCLLPQDRVDSGCYVKVIATAGRYFIEYRMPDELAPWPEAFITGETSAVDRAVQMIDLAMLNSRGWQ